MNFTLAATLRKPLSVRTRLCLDLILFKLTWLLLVLGQDAMLWQATSLQLTGLFMQPRSKTVLLQIVLVAASGIILDFLFFSYGLFQFLQPGFPLWLLLLWVAFARTLCQTLSVVQRLNLFWLLIAGMVTGTIGYGVGYLLGAVQFPLPVWFTLPIVAVGWAVFFPWAVRITKP